MVDAQELFLRHVSTIERIAAFVARRGHLSDTDGEDFAAFVNVELIERNYEIIRKFEGRSEFSTYLMTVIQRLFYQFRVKEWGKWRPSAEARRLGDKGILVEKLLTRDNYSLGEVVQILTTGCATCTPAEIEAIYARLPLRVPRPVLVSDDISPDAIAGGSEPDDALFGENRAAIAREASAAVDKALAGLEQEDVLILRLRFFESWKVPEIAEALALDQKKTYKRIDKLLKKLRMTLQRSGLSRRDIDDLLFHGDQELKFIRLSGGKLPPRPSHKTYGGLRGR
jgi:RNA polymerase sigma factor (sigma-70 family)